MFNCIFIIHKAIKLIFIIGLFTLSIMAASNDASAHEAGEHEKVSIPPWPYHAALVSSGLVVLTAGMLTARFMKDRRWWMRAHKTQGLLGASLAVAGVLVAVYMVSMYMKTYFAGGIHSYLGLVALLLVIATPILGFMQFGRKDKRVRELHRWSGRLTLLFMLANLIIGLQMILK